MPAVFLRSNYGVALCALAVAGELHASAQDAADVRVWLAPVVVFDDIPGADAERLYEQVRRDLEAAVHGGMSAGVGALHLDRPRPSMDGRIAEARALLGQGEERYMAFEFAPAAANLAEAAALLTSALADLDEADAQRLYQARLLEGISWLEAAQEQSALAAFEKLLLIRPDFEPDPSLVPPPALQLFERARRKIRASGSGAIEVRSDPPGATVIVDGIPRGASPISVTGLPPGRHGLRLVHDGYVNHAEEVVVGARTHLQKSVTLQPMPALAALNRVIAGAKAGQTPALMQQDLETVRQAARAGSVALLGVARRSDGGVVVSARRLGPGDESAVVWSAAHTQAPLPAGEIARQLLASARPPLRIPADAPALDTDFTRAILGFGPAFGRSVVLEEEGSVLTSWWFWAGAAVVVGGGVAAAVALTADDTPGGRSEDRVYFTADYP